MPRSENGDGREIRRMVVCNGLTHAGLIVNGALRVLDGGPADQGARDKLMVAGDALADAIEALDVHAH